MIFNAQILPFKLYNTKILWRYKFIFVFCALFLFKSNLLFSSCPVPGCNMASPKLNCLSVLPNGDVTLTWSLPTTIDPAFDSYQIFSSSSLAGPYTNIGSVVSSSQTTFNHVGANANIASVYYYVLSHCTGNIFSTAVDTLKTMYLSVINPLNGTAKLSWNPLSNPSSPSSAINYNIYQEFPSGVWTAIGSKQNTNVVNYNYIDTILICNNTINYRVEIGDNSGCVSASSIAGGPFQNSIAPLIPVFDSLSVNDNNITVLSWNKSVAVDTKGYVVYTFNGVSWVIIDTVLGINNTSYINPTSTPNSASEQYRIVAYDSCGNPSPLSLMYSTMFLKSAADICNRSAKLNWTAYPQKIGNGLALYLIYQSQVSESGPFTLVGSANSAALTYTVSGLEPKTNYYFKITAIDSSGTKTASSNRVLFYSATPQPPKYLYLRNATVVAAKQIDITCHIDVTASISNYKVFRAIYNGTPSPLYSQIGTIQPSGSTPIYFSDIDVNPEKNSYLYKLRIVDSCGFDGIETNVGRTILLTTSSKSYVMQNFLYWNNYENWLSGVNSYNIYRGVDGVMEPTPIANIPANSINSYTYTDDVSFVLNGSGIFEYYIEAVEEGGNVFGFADKSLSNVAKAYQDPIIYIPNAFVPEGSLNKVFKPVTTYVDNEEYEFSVFDRWGGVVFTTKNVAEGWDGTINGTKCGMGVFVYLIKIKTSRGDYKSLKGTITLID